VRMQSKNKLLLFLGSAAAALVAVVSSSSGCEEGRTLSSDPVDFFQRSASENVFPSKVVRYIRGRLGNHMAGYMFALTLSLRYGINFLLARVGAVFGH
jgi:hypothetical protein